MLNENFNPLGFLDKYIVVQSENNWYRLTESGSSFKVTVPFSPLMQWLSFDRFYWLRYPGMSDPMIGTGRAIRRRGCVMRNGYVTYVDIALAVAVPLISYLNPYKSSNIATIVIIIGYLHSMQALDIQWT